MSNASINFLNWHEFAKKLTEYKLRPNCENPVDKSFSFLFDAILCWNTKFAFYIPIESKKINLFFTPLKLFYRNFIEIESTHKYSAILRINLQIAQCAICFRLFKWKNTQTIRWSVEFEVLVCMNDQWQEQISSEQHGPQSRIHTNHSWNEWWSITFRLRYFTEFSNEWRCLSDSMSNLRHY